MVLTDRQRSDLHQGIYEYLLSMGHKFKEVCNAFEEADPESCKKHIDAKNSTTSTPLLEKKWTAVPRLQKRVLELERNLSQVKNYSYRNQDNGNSRRLIPKEPCLHTLEGHSSTVCLESS